MAFYGQKIKKGSVVHLLDPRHPPQSAQPWHRSPRSLTSSPGLSWCSERTSAERGRKCWRYARQPPKKGKQMLVSSNSQIRVTLSPRMKNPSFLAGILVAYIRSDQLKVESTKKGIEKWHRQKWSVISLGGLWRRKPLQKYDVNLLKNICFKV